MGQEDQLDEFIIEEEKEAPYFRKFFAGLIDAAIVIPSTFFFITYFPEFYYTLFGNLNGAVIMLILLAVYRLLTICPLGATIGMFICRIKFLNGHDQSPTLIERVVASFFILINGIRYYNR